MPTETINAVEDKPDDPVKAAVPSALDERHICSYQRVFYDATKCATDMTPHEIDTEHLGEESDTEVTHDITKPNLSLEKLDRLFRDNPKLIEVTKKTFSESLQRDFAGDVEREFLERWFRGRGENISSRRLSLIHMFKEMAESPLSSPPEAEAWQSDRKMILQDDLENRNLAEVEIQVQEGRRGKHAPWMGLVYSVDNETAKRYLLEKDMLGTFAAPKDIKFHGIYIGILGKEKRVLLSEAVQSEKFSAVTIDPALIEDFIEMIDPPLDECKDALTEIARLGSEFGIEQEKIETLKIAVQEFATYVKPKPTTYEEGIGEIGKCFTVPHIFVRFVHEWYGLEIATGFYEHCINGLQTFFHQVNVLDGKIVVDWTAQQCEGRNKEPYPFVYRVGDPRFESWGSLSTLEKRYRCDPWS